MFNLIQIRISIKNSIILFAALFLQLTAFAQEETVIDNKGNIIVVKNNQVTTAATAPISPLENDIWFDTTAELTKIFDGTIWLTINLDALALKEDSANKSTDITLSDVTNLRFPTELAVKTYVDAFEITDIIAGNQIATITETNGTAVEINETITTLETPAGIEGTLRYTSESGVVDIPNIVRSVNGVTPAPNGNVAVILSSTTTGLEADLPVTAVDSDIYIVTGEVAPNADRNGVAFIYDDPSGWQEVTTDLSTNDARYVNEIGDGMTGPLAMGNNSITNVNDPVNLQDVATKNYVDNVAQHTGTVGSIYFAGTGGNPIDNNGQLFWNNTLNRLGVGTSSPSNKLHITGAIRSEGYLNSNGTVTEPSYRFNGDSDTGIFRPATNQLGFTTNGTEAIRIDASQNIGIGISTPDESLHIANNMRLDGSFEDKDGDTGTAGQILSSTVTGTDWINSASGTISTNADNSLSIGTDSGIFYESPIKAFGKISAAGAVIRATAGVSVTKLGGNGRYQVNLPATAVSDTNYIIQLTQPGRGGAGNDDPGISYNNQTATSFEVIIGDNDNGGTDRARFNSEFMFTILDL